MKKCFLILGGYLVICECVVYVNVLYNWKDWQDTQTRQRTGQNWQQQDTKAKSADVIELDMYSDTGQHDTLTNKRGKKEPGKIII